MTSLYDSLPPVYGTGEVLHDEKNNWRDIKLRNEAVAASFEDPDSQPMMNRFERMMECGAYLKFAVSASGEKRLIYARFCRDRMCPGCQKRRSLVVFHQVKNICQSIQSDFPTYKYLLLTLTVPNVKAEQLSDEIKHLHQSWHRMSRRSFFQKSIKGWFRALEVTYNGERDDYHPHIHVLLCVPPSYFKKTYISRDRWLEYWQEATRYSHITQVDVRAIRPNKNRPESDAITSAAAEVGKYATKPSNYVCKAPNGQYFAVHKVVRELAEGIARKRMVAFGGVMKDYHLKLEQQDVDSDSVDLVHIDDDSKAIDAVMVHIYRWNVGFGNYIG